MSMEERLRQFLAQSPDEAMVLVSLAAICHRDGRVAEAIELLTRAISADAGYMAAYPLLGECYEATGATENAQQAYRHAQQLARDAGDMAMVEEVSARLDALEGDI